MLSFDISLRREEQPSALLLHICCLELGHVVEAGLAAVDMIVAQVFFELCHFVEAGRAVVDMIAAQVLS